MANWKPDEWKTSMAPYLVVKDAAKAIEFYTKALGATEICRMPGPGGKIMHAELRVGDSVFMLADEFPEMKCMSPVALNGSPVTIMMYVQDVDKAFDQAVKAGATVTMPVADMFWGDRYGNFSDPFGHRWALATHKEDLTPEQMMQRQKEFMEKQMAGAAHK
jgi:PhnB protein